MGTAAKINTTTAFQIAEIGLISPIARWCECLHGCAPFQEALGAITKAIGAEAAALCRLNLHGADRGRGLYYDQTKSSVRTGDLQQSFAHVVLGGYVAKAKPGMIWYSSLSGNLDSPALEHIHRARGLSDLAVIPLTSGSAETDFLELHFMDHPGPVQQALLNTLSSTLVRTWSNRAPGLYLEACLKTSRTRKPEMPDTHLLSMTNPARLSRAEYRVCVLLSKGQSVKRVSHQLGISASTLRTHLRNIYAKTDIHNMSELVYRLVAMVVIDDENVSRGTAA